MNLQYQVKNKKRNNKQILLLFLVIYVKNNVFTISKSPEILIPVFAALLNDRTNSFQMLLQDNNPVMSGAVCHIATCFQPLQGFFFANAMLPSGWIDGCPFTLFPPHVPEPLKCVFR